MVLSRLKDQFISEIYLAKCSAISGKISEAEHVNFISKKKNNEN